MRHRQLGRSGLRVSAVGLGCNNFGPKYGGRLDFEGTRAVVEAALDCGINLFDTANSYGGNGASEELLGRALRTRRDEAVVATKFGSDMGEPPGTPRAARGYVRRAVEDSLRRLGTDRIDLYQLHRPDGITPFEETLSTLDDLVHQGKVLYIGSSNLAAWQVVEMDWLARSIGAHRMISAQNEYSLLQPGAEAELLPACAKVGVGLLPYFPLAHGLLTGKYRQGRERPAGTRMDGRDIPAPTWARIEALAGFAEDRGHTLLDLAFAGLLAHPAVGSVIAGATKPEQVKANVAAAGWELGAADVGELAALLPAPSPYI